MIERRAILAPMAALLAVPALAGGLAGCGRKGSLEAPPDRKPSYPRSYPAKETPKDAMKTTSGGAMDSDTQDGGNSGSSGSGAAY